MALHHARLLLERMQERVRTKYGPGSYRIPVNNLREHYRQMCDEPGLARRPWNPVAAAFAEITRQPGRPLKNYETWIDQMGMQRRRRVYRVTID